MPQSGQIAREAGLPFFMVTLSNSSPTSFLARHFTQYIVIVFSPPFNFLEPNFYFKNTLQQASSKAKASIVTRSVFVKSALKKLFSVLLELSLIFLVFSVLPNVSFGMTKPELDCCVRLFCVFIFCFFVRLFLLMSLLYPSFLLQLASWRFITF